MPEPLVLRWLNDYGEEVTEKMLADFLEEKPMKEDLFMFIVVDLPAPFGPRKP